MAACSPRKSESNANTAVHVQSSEHGLDPITMAHQAFELIMQLEGRDNKDPIVVGELGLLGEKVERMSEHNQRIYYSELERLYIGDDFSGTDEK